MVRLALLVEPENGRALAGRLLGLPGAGWRFDYCHEPSGKAVKGWVWFYPGRRVVKRCRRLGISLLGTGYRRSLGCDVLAGAGGRPVVYQGDMPPVNNGQVYLVNCLLEVWRKAMRFRGIDPARARVVVAGLEEPGLLCLQALARETHCLTLTGDMNIRPERVLARILYETGVAVNIESETGTAFREADAVFLAGRREEYPIGELTRGAWVYSLNESRPVMVRVPGRISVHKGLFSSLAFYLLSKTLPEWAVRLGRGSSGDEGFILPADYAEALLLALEGGTLDLYREEIRLKQLHQINRLGINYQLKAV